MNICIYCRGSADAAVSREHVLPEALGNATWTLPVATVCDPCNNRLGSTVDAPFVSSGFGAIRSMLGGPSRSDC